MAKEVGEKARVLLEEALAQTNELHLPGARALHRERLTRVLDLTGQVLGRETDATTAAKARVTRALAQAARAEDARHGAGQLSRSAQRAPTIEDCELGWKNVETIASGAEAAAADAQALSALVDDARVRKATAAAAKAAAQARVIVERRNHAYTFHADPAFSFGEGWYVAAAGVLAKVEIQVEASQSQSVQAMRFLRDAGLGAQVVAYRSRPRAKKGLPAIIAAAFKENATRAQRALRAAFLGDEGVAESVANWADEALSDVPRDAPKVLVWVREGVHDAERNSMADELAELCRRATQRGIIPLLFGDAAAVQPRGAVDLTLCWKLPHFQGEQMRRAQLQLFEHLVAAHRLVGQVGVTTAGMDGPALMGLWTMYITDQPNPRLGRWVGAVPGYEEVVRREGYLEAIEMNLSRWTLKRSKP
ncbi:MAG: hypothetical protein AB8H86_08680 [Polyangiales bacterium]